MTISHSAPISCDEDGSSKQSGASGPRWLDAATLRDKLGHPWSVAEALGLLDGAKRARSGLMIRCPFHPDRTPSLSLGRGRTGNLIWNCFGCGARGDVFDLLARLHDVDVRMQFKKVLDIANAVAMRVPVTGEDGNQLAGSIILLTSEDFAVVASAVLRRTRLADQSDVVDYLRRRRVLDEAVVAGVGALPRDVEAQEHLLQDVADEVGGERLLGSGLCGARGGFAWPDNRLLVPWIDRAGAITTLQRRRLDDVEPKYVFPAGRGASLPYGSDALRFAPAGQTIAIVEGVIDVFALRSLCFRHGVHRVVIGIGGVESWRSEWGELARGRHAIVALDRDAAGHAAASKLRRDLTRAGAKEISRAVPRAGKDWADALAAEAS